MHQAKPRMSFSPSFDLRVVAAFAAIYFLWGSTFLAIRYALDVIPPFLLIAFRSLGAGIILYIWAMLRGETRSLTWAHWRSAALGGVLFFVFGHGLLSWSEQHVASGVAAVVLALIPVWVVVLDWLRPGGVRPSLPTLLGILLGFIGLVLLVGPAAVSGGISANVVATLFLALGALAWAAGTLYSRSRASSAPPVATSAMQLLWGGSLLLVFGSAMGEWPVLLGNTMTIRVILSMLFLIVFGSVVTFSAYIWLLRVRSPARVATYAYINPLVAVFLGWLLAGEEFTMQTLAASALIVAAVVIIITFQGNSAKPKA